MMKRLLLLFLLLPAMAWGQLAAGTWGGTLDVNGSKLRLLFHLSQTPEGWQATMDSPDQGAKGIPVDSVAVTPSAVTLCISPLRARFDGAFFGETTLMGLFTQGSFSTSLLLKRGEPTPPCRPQQPQAPFPYRSEEVSFAGRDGALTLHGTLTLPATEGHYPAVVLVTGSGTQNRDEELLGHKPFLLLADRLTRAGYAVLRYDDRGFNASPEELARLKGSTTHDLMQDALGAFDFLRNHPHIAHHGIGIAGHSEGGTIALMAAAEEPAVAFVISLAGMTVSGAELLATQNRAVLLLQGVPESLADSYAEALRRLYGAWVERTPAAVAAEKEQLAAEATAGLQLPAPWRQNLEQLAAMAEQQPWMDAFVRLDPAPAIAALGGRPCLALNGAKDVQVDAAANLGRLRQLAPEGASVETKCYEGLNHLFQPCTTGAVAEYGQIETTMDEQVLQDIITWLNARQR